MQERRNSIANALELRLSSISSSMSALGCKWIVVIIAMEVIRGTSVV